LVGVDLGKEVGPMLEVLRVEEFPLDGAVYGFDIGVGVGTMRRVELVARAPALLDGADEAVGLEVHGVAIELGAKVGANLDFPQVHAVSGQSLS